jgi:hypothetical protein
MSYEYLVMTNKELIKVFGEPIDATTVPTTELLAEGWTLDENGKDITAPCYGKSGWKRPDVAERNRNTRPTLGMKFSAETNAKKGLKGKDNPNYKHGGYVKNVL